MQLAKQITTMMMFVLVAAASTVSEAQSWRRPPGPPPGRPGPGPGPGWGMHIQSASYGQNCGAAYGNATYSVQNECRGRMDCAYLVSVNKIGDPAYGCAKDFRVQYVCPGGQTKTTFVNPEANTQTAYMSCGGGGGGGGWYSIRILSATYGGNFPEIQKGNVTYDIARECNGRQQCNYLISVNKIGDPKYGWSKDYRVEYTCDGRRTLTAYVPPEANTQTVSLRCF